MLWFLVVVLLGSVSEAQDSVECVASSNALTGVRTCYEAVGNVTQRTQDAVQFAMACTDGEQCKDLWRTMINNCNPDFSGADVASLICAMPNPNTTCNDVLNNTIGYDDAYALVLRVTASCLTGYLTNGICAAECAASLRNATDSMGCCWAEFVDILDTSLLLNASALQISWMITSLPALCNVDTPFCYDHAIPAPNDCDNFRQELFVTNAACGAAVIPFHRSQYRTGINEVLNTEGCPALYGRFTAACSPLDMASLYVFNAVGAIIGDLGQVERCRPFIPEIIASNFNYPCHRSFLSRVCTDQCREAIDRGINRYGCCYRDFFRAFYGKSLNAADNTLFAFEETIYGLCGRQPTDYCRQEVVQVTDAASSCINAGNTYYNNNDFCLPYFRAFHSPLPFGDFEANARSICVNQLCKGFLGKFSSYARACEAFGVDADVNLLGSFDFVATLYPNATCRRNDRGSCLPVLLFSTRITAVHSAFDTDGSAACIPVFTDGQCPVECAQLLVNARAEIGCCLNEYGLAFLGAENFSTLSTVCNFVATRCTEYAINPAIDECARAENAIKANSTCSSAFTSVISILSAGARGVTIVQLDGYFNIMCQGSCGDLVSRYFTACEAKIDTDAGFRQFASDFQALACRSSDVTGLSCYAINLVEPTIKTLKTAFDPTSGICSSLLRSADNTCPATCKTMLEEAINASGCCLNDISTQALSSLVRRVTFEDVLDACDIMIVRTCSTGGRVFAIPAITFLALIIALLF
ncbi:uncharacterized protein [Dysidea avara]|uniref:uncharacterized protein isoform X2 n=1 Tax=Dysidea avara TaxID=196820 RepID=UPI00331D0E18